MRELRPGLWHWQAPHPGWSSDSDGWDTLLGGGRDGVRIPPDSWLPVGVSAAEFGARLRPLLALPIELLLLTHGEPVVVGARDALARALG